MICGDMGEIEPVRVYDYRCPVCEEVYKMAPEEAKIHCNQPVNDLIIPPGFIWRNAQVTRETNDRGGKNEYYNYVKGIRGLDKSHERLYLVGAIRFEKEGDFQASGIGSYPLAISLGCLRNGFSGGAYSLIEETDNQIGTKRILNREEPF